MKKFFIMVLIQFFMLIILSSQSLSDSVKTIVEQYGKQYNALKPPPNSSINTDYKQQQIALGSFYSVKIMEQIYNQNKKIADKNDQMLKKYAEIIQQNKQIIQLLSTLVKKETNSNRLLKILINGEKPKE